MSEEIMEKWLPVKGYEGLYEISNIGNIKTKARMFRSGYNTVRTIKEKILKNQFNKRTGYKYIRLCKDGVIERFTVHKLIAILIAINFLERQPHHQCVNHKDGDKLNNCFHNLEWTTYKNNVNHAFKTGLMKPTMKGRFGANHNRHKDFKSKQ